MSNIEENLAFILSSRYGRDVRQAIHDAIHDCYEDGKAGAVDLVAREQIANLVANEGTTEKDSELVDIRVGADGTQYTSAGEAVRDQVGDLKSALDDVTDFTISNNAGISVGAMLPGSYIKPSDGTNGTATYACRTNYIGVSGPVLMNVNFDRETYRYTAWGYSGANIASAVKKLTADDWSAENKLFIDPGDTIKYIRIGIIRNDRTGTITENDAATIGAGIHFTKTVDNGSIGKMLSVGNSILTGSVWVNGAFDHLADYDNAPYGCVAKALDLDRVNVTHELHSSSGLIYDSGTGCFLDDIKTRDISVYDFILTHLYQQDLNEISMGDINSVVGDGTIVGGVKDLVSYINTNNPQCRLILVGVPPVNYQPTVTGNKVFTGKYANGYSIADADTLMLELASELNFTYISWQDMGLSYYYQDYTDGDNIHANNEVTYRTMGDYLGIALQYSYDSVIYQKRMKYIEEAETENSRGIEILGKTVFVGSSIDIGALTEGSTINPQTGANMSAGNATRTTYIAFDAPVLITFIFDLSVYAYDIFTYSSSSISDVAENPTNGIWCDNSQILVDVPASQTPRFRIGVKRKDGAAMTTDVTDPDSDFYKIKNGIAVNKFIASQTDFNLLNPDNCIPVAGAGETTTYGVTITSNGAGVYRVKGTPTQSTVYNIYTSVNAMPPRIKPGVTYKVRFRPSQRYASLQIASYQNGEYTTLFNQNYDGYVTIPNNAEGMRIRLYFLNTYDNDYLVCPQMFVANSIGMIKYADKPTVYPKMFTIIDDDGYGYYYRDLLPLCREKNVSISSAIVANYIGERAGYMTWEQVEECYASGCEILSHSLDHKTPEEIIADADTIEIIEHKYRMAKHILRLHGIESKILVFNNSTGDMDVCQEAAKRVYSGAIHAVGSEINTPDSNPYYIKRFDFTAKSSGRDPFTYEQMKENVDLLVSADSGWLVWMIHTSSTGGWSADEVSKIGRIIDYARENDIMVTTVEHAMKVYYGI